MGNHRTVDYESVFAMLDQNDLSMSEIAKRVGLSRERVRQIAATYKGVSGKDRSRMRLDEALDCVPFVKAARVRGLEVVPLTNSSGNLRRKEFLVNGKFCKLSKVTQRWPGSVKISPMASCKGFDVIVWSLPDGRFIFKNTTEIPAGSVGETTLSLLGSSRKGKHSGPSFYRSGIEAWSVFEKQREEKPCVVSDFL